MTLHGTVLVNPPCKALRDRNGAPLGAARFGQHGRVLARADLHRLAARAAGSEAGRAHIAAQVADRAGTAVGRAGGHGDRHVRRQHPPQRAPPALTSSRSVMSRSCGSEPLGPDLGRLVAEG